MPLNSPTDDYPDKKKGGKLFIVATPIGNKDDITVRAINVLGEVDLIAAEDTRETGKLLADHNIKNKLLSYHEHNATRRTPALIGKLEKGLSIALLSDAGTPSVSDPGYRLIKEAVAKNIRVIPIPGVSAATAALSASGLATDSFIFIGFAAKKKQKRQKQLQELADENRTMVFYESPRRVISFLDEIIETMGDRYAVLAREMTKRYEEFIRGHLSEIKKKLKKRPSIKGEITLLVSASDSTTDVSMDAVRDDIVNCLKGEEIRLSEVVKKVSKKHHVAKNLIYHEALKIKGR
ncbi:MAG: 16S rRNA (cytidine(1402)-2'-O)-methyltransferase [Thermodesulfobacteriota bacterium]|nr:16S rRNA (cytidine(1402)-2'-O)-methyltransferase [Thermodesulfobacteriota bacterium]